jgi:hypothetical protein
MPGYCPKGPLVAVGVSLVGAVPALSQRWMRQSVVYAKRLGCTKERQRGRYDK